MRWVASLLALSTLFTSLIYATPPDNGDEAAVLRLVDEFFDALEKREPERWKAFMLSGTVRVTPLVDEEGNEYVRIRSMEEGLASLAEGDPRFVERGWDPTVMVRGRIAMVWMPYDFHIDGKFSHCGVDLFEFVKLNGAWKMANIMWTVEREGCEASPLGPLGQ